MIYEIGSDEELWKIWDKDKGMRGPSPGGAAGELGITRQGVYSAVKRGSLDMLRVSEKGGGSPSLFITNKSIERYKLNQGKPGPRPGFRQRVKVSFDKHVHHIWPDDK